MSAPHYFDHAATTPVDARVAAAMAPWLGERFGNPAAAHGPGERARAAIEGAREQVAALIGAEPREIVFTSGATEADNLAILGLARGRGRGHLVSTRIEHKAVLEPLRQLQREGFAVTWLDPDAQGRIDPEVLRQSLRADTRLVSVMHANNEIGVVQDIAAIGALCRAAGVPLHVDAAQSAGKLPIDVRALAVDLLSLSAHKFNGPQGVGALYVRTPWRTSLQPLQFGGGQERGLRAGTLPVHQIVGLGAAAEIARHEADGESLRVAQLRDRLLAGIQAAGGVQLNGGSASRLPGILNLSFAGVHGEALLAALPELALSTSAACNADSDETSYVLRAIGCEPLLAQATLRFSLGRTTTAEDVEVASAALLRELPRLRAVADLDSLTLPSAVAGAPGWGLGEAGERATGTQIRWRVQVAGGLIRQADFRAFASVPVLRACTLLSTRLVGSPADSIDLAETAGGVGGPLQWQAACQVPATQLGALLRVEDALRLALQASRSQAGSAGQAAAG